MNQVTHADYLCSFDGSKKTATQLKDRARSLGHQVEQWTNDQSAADFLAEIAKRGEGVYDVDLPQNVKDGRFLSSIVEITPNKARVIVTPNGSIITAYPYNNSWECGRYV